MISSQHDAPTRVVGRRVVAFIIDGIIIGAINSALFFAFASKDTEVVRSLESGDIGLDTTLYGNFTFGDTSYSVYGSKAGVLFLLLFLIWLGYWVVLQGLKGFTPGKAAMGLRVVKDDNTLPAGIPRALARQLLFIVDGFPYVLYGLTGFIVAKTSDRNQRVGDKVAGTLVVRKEAVGAGPATSSPVPGQAPWMAPPPPS